MIVENYYKRSIGGITSSCFTHFFFFFAVVNCRCWVIWSPPPTLIKYWHLSSEYRRYSLEEHVSKASLLIINMRHERFQSLCLTKMTRAVNFSTHTHTLDQLSNDHRLLSCNRWRGWAPTLKMSKARPKGVAWIGVSCRLIKSKWNDERSSSHFVFAVLGGIVVVAWKYINNLFTRTTIRAFRNLCDLSAGFNSAIYKNNWIATWSYLNDLSCGWRDALTWKWEGVYL